MARVWLGLGSNVGAREEHLSAAIDAINEHLSNLEKGNLYETAPMDFTDQADFLNTAVCGETELSPMDLLIKMQQIEHQGGRNRSAAVPKGPRTIDIDILMYDNLIISEDFGGGLTLTVPHPSMHERLFVLKPLLDLDIGL